MLNADSFQKVALRCFYHQATHNPVYRQYIGHLGIDPLRINCLEEVPFLPISFFKTQQVKTGEWVAPLIFESSGTTGMQASRHYVRDPGFYLAHSREIFSAFYGPVENYHILALLPSYLERGNSSLVYMVDHFMSESHSPYSGFYLDDHDALLTALDRAYQDTDRRTLLWGVSFALLDLIEKVSLDMPDLVVMETGGMKGRRKEIIREDLHARLKAGFGTAHIHSEYGMTELMSQAYSKSEGLFVLPPSMKVLLRDLNDPFSLDPDRDKGGMNIIDLANTHTCAFIETQDIAQRVEGDSFRVIGRFDGADVRGCNLMLA